MRTDITIVWGGVRGPMRVTLNDGKGSVRVISNPEDTFVGAPVVVRYSRGGKTCRVIPVCVIGNLLDFQDNI
jgi:hypothetical protein